MISSSAVAQPYCGLRDPVQGIFKAFPEATSYRSITRTLGPEHRSAIAAELPFTLHFNELGRHTVYLPLQGDRPMGLIHVRSEQGRYGLVEIGWVLGVDLHVKDVWFQRCRDTRARTALEQLQPVLQGATIQTLKRHLQGVESPEQEMIIRSGLKTLAATWAAWREDVLPHQAMQVAAIAFESAQRVMPLEVELKGLNPEWGLPEETVAAFDVIDSRGAIVGTLVRLDWPRDAPPLAHELDLWWVLGRRGTLESIRRANGLTDDTCSALMKSAMNGAHPSSREAAVAQAISEAVGLAREAAR
ncbi:MAG: hypothetical protein MK101_09800 [Phycisphaerales bacterium]|nr:hypothetical protein [Phycisphaerales bacterium]